MAPPEYDCFESELVPSLLPIRAEQMEIRQGDETLPDLPAPLPLQQRETEYG